MPNFWTFFEYQFFKKVLHCWVQQLTIKKYIILHKQFEYKFVKAWVLLSKCTISKINQNFEYLVSFVTIFHARYYKNCIDIKFIFDH